MSRFTSAPPWSVVGLGLFVAAAVGAAATLAVTPQPTPPALATAKPLGDARVSERQYDDQRTVEVGLETGGERQVSSPLSGTTTANVCTPGGTLASGSRVAAIDGQSIMGLATGEPLWRDLAKDDTGDDVRALQAELARLGERVRVDGIIGDETIDAVARILGAPQNTTISTIPFAAFAWLPSPSVTTTSCPALVGGTVETGEPLAVLPVALSGARISSLPDRLVGGARTLTVGEIEAPVSPDGTVDDPAALAALAASPDYASATASGDEPTLTGAYSLTKPLHVKVVPPAALYATNGTSACVASEGQAIRVEIVGSELGETFVVPVKAKLTRVSLSSKRPRCR